MESQPGLCTAIQWFAGKVCKGKPGVGGRLYCRQGRLMWSGDSGWMMISIWKNYLAKNNSSKSESAQKWTHPNCVITWGMSSHFQCRARLTVWEKPFGRAHFRRCEVVGVFDDLSWSLCWRHPRFLNHREVLGMDAMYAEYLRRYRRAWRWARSPRQPSSLC